MKGIYVVTSRMMNQRQELNSIADNVANANTTGFKKLGYDFATLSARKQGEKVADFSMNRGIYIDYTAGPINMTNRPLDVAIAGEGFFGVDDNGSIHYTRDGSFNLDPEGRLITADGNPVVDANNAEIQIPAGSTQIKISKEGVISNQNGVIGQLGVFTFDKEQTASLQRTGNGRVMPTDNSEPTVNETPTLLQHALESSNVNPITETVRMTELTRSYQSAAKLIGTLEDLEQRAVRQLSAMP